jgi:hypothetical protein
MTDNPNPYESPEIERPKETSARSARGQQLWRGAVAVLVVGVFVGLTALGRLVAGVAGLMTLPPESEAVGVGGRPLIPEEFTQGQYKWALERAGFNLISGVVFAVFAWLLLRYARQLRLAADGTMSHGATLKAQNACWYMAAALVILYVARLFNLPIVSLG